MTAPKPRTVVICSHCRSADVTQDANASWSPSLQEYELSGTMDASYCNNCDGDCRLLEIPIVDRVAWLQERLNREEGVDVAEPGLDRDDMEGELNELIWALSDPGKSFYLAQSQFDGLKAMLVLAADKLEDWGTDIQQDITAEEDELERWRTEYRHYKAACEGLGITPETFPKEMTDGA